MVSAPSSIDNDYVYIASVNRKFPQFGNSIDDEREAEEQPPEETTYPPPVFDFGMPRNITTRTGHTAAINCRVDNLGDKSVSESAGKWLHLPAYHWIDFASNDFHFNAFLSKIFGSSVKLKIKLAITFPMQFLAPQSQLSTYPSLFPYFPDLGHPCFAGSMRKFLPSAQNLQSGLWPMSSLLCELVLYSLSFTPFFLFFKLFKFQGILHWIPLTRTILCTGFNQNGLTNWRRTLKTLIAQMRLYWGSVFDKSFFRYCCIALCKTFILIILYFYST